MESKCIYDKVITFENLYLAYRQVRLNKRDYNIQQKYEFDLECNLINLQKRLKDPRKYKVKKYNKFKIYEPKMRQVSAPYFEDRIVHQAIHKVIEPKIVSKFIPTTYACIEKRGTHKAVKDLYNSLCSEVLRGGGSFLFKS